MIRWGLTAAGTQRWQCPDCDKGQCWKRPDTAQRNVARLRERWFLGFLSLTSVARRIGVHRITLSRRLGVSGVSLPPVPLKQHPKNPVLVLDGTAISKITLLILAYDTSSDQPIAWSFARKENFETWHRLLLRVSERFTPHALVSDGQKGLQKAAKLLFPGILHQRCMAHVIRLSLAWLTRNPQTDAGKELRVLVRRLAQTKTQDQAKIWRDAFIDWHKHHDEFLKEKSINLTTNRKWYTHRKLRAVRSLVANASPNLFWFTSDSMIPNTTNAVEGGINSPLAELLHRHRGITEQQKKALVTRFLYARRKRNSPTQNAT